jgi:predicted MFS family arabinose efflux permease
MASTSVAIRRPELGYVAVLGSAVCCYAALGAVLSILPRYVPDRLGGGAAAVGVAVGAPALSGLLARPVGGRVADRLGPRVPLLAGAAVMALAAVPAAVSSTLAALLASRLAVGAGEGMMMSATVLWLLRLAGPHRRGRALGHIGLANFAGLALGPLLASAVGGAHPGAAVLWAAVPLPLVGAAWAAAQTAPPGPERDRAAGVASTRTLARVTARAGVGLLLVNVGYVSVLSFGAALARQHATGLEELIVPVFAGVVLVSRTVAGNVPDRLGGRRTVVAFAGAEAVGLFAYSQAGTLAPQLVALLVLSIGQSLAVPGLGLLALTGVAAAEQGAAAGLFFAWFDAGVALGGPAVGAVASLTSASGALLAAAGAVTGAVLLSLMPGHRR